MGAVALAAIASGPTAVAAATFVAVAAFAGLTAWILHRDRTLPEADHVAPLLARTPRVSWIQFEREFWSYVDAAGDEVEDS